jgi:hypothetical protein
MKKSQIIKKKAKVDEKSRKWTISGFFVRNTWENAKKGEIGRKRPKWIKNLTVSGFFRST